MMSQTSAALSLRPDQYEALQSDSAQIPNTLLEYRNDAAIENFRSSFDLPEQEVEEIFRETMKWMWLNEATKHLRNSEGLRLAIDKPIVIIDEMWHSFILCTREYAKFCERFFGRFIHHRPTTMAEHDALRTELEGIAPADRAAWAREKKIGQYTAVYDYLGHDTFVKWYMTYPELYPVERIVQLRKK